MKDNKICIATSNYNRKSYETLFSFLLVNNIESVSIESLLNEIKVSFDNFDENITNEAFEEPSERSKEELIDYFGQLIKDDYDKALEILKRTDYEERKSPSTPIICIDEPQLLNPFDLLEPNLLKDKPERPWDTRKDFFTKVSSRGYKRKKHKRK